jgi:arylsulfatase A-like enzyme
MKKPNSLYLFLIFSTGIPYFSAAQKVKKKPNIILILTDDQPYDYMGCLGNPIVRTPNLDKLASDGVLFSNYHITSAISTPSRVSMFTGQYERKHGVNFNSGTSVSTEAWDDSYSSQLKKAGYYTGYIGKNHAPVGDGGYESGYMENSFDYWYGGHEHLSFYPKSRHSIFKGAKNDTQVEVLQEGVIDFLNGNGYNLKGALHFLDNRPQEKPFCLTIAFNLPHDAGTSTMKMLPTDSSIYRTLYRDMDIPLPKNYSAKADIITPKLPASVLHVRDRQNGYDWVDDVAGYKEMTIRKLETMTGIDGLVGDLRKKIKEMNLDENTVIIFSSDHGLFSGQQGLGGKALCYEVVTHVPLIVFNPLLPEKKRSGKNGELVQSVDLAATMLNLAGIKAPESYQGFNINGLLSGKKKKLRDYVFTENLWSTHFGNPRIEAVQDKEWKYIRYYKNENVSALDKINAAKLAGKPNDKSLYAVTDKDALIYRNYVEAPFRGEKPVYEELYNLKADPDEMINCVSNIKYSTILIKMRNVCDVMVKEARGTGEPKVLRYTKESQAERNAAIPKVERKKKAVIKDDH